MNSGFLLNSHNDSMMEKKNWQEKANKKHKVPSFREMRFTSSFIIYGVFYSMVTEKKLSAKKEKSPKRFNSLH